MKGLFHENYFSLSYEGTNIGVMIKYLRIEFFKNNKFDKVKIIPVESYDQDIIGKLVLQYGNEVKIYKCNQRGNNYSNRLVAVYGIVL